MTVAYPVEMVERVRPLDADELGARGRGRGAGAPRRGPAGRRRPRRPHAGRHGGGRRGTAHRRVCPNDAKRFADPAAGRSWMAKGRGLVTIVDGAGALLAYGWSGA